MKYKNGLSIRNTKPVKRVMICGSPVVIDAMQKKAASLGKTLSGLCRDAVFEYQTKGEKNEKI